MLKVMFNYDIDTDDQLLKFAVIYLSQIKNGFSVTQPSVDRFLATVWLYAIAK